jgi:hypothetical protein
MQIKLGRRDRGMSLIAGLIILGLFLVLLGGLFLLMVRACHKINNGNGGGGSEMTNELSYAGPGTLVSQQFVTVEIPTNTIVAERIEYTDSLLSPWQPLTNFVLEPDQVLDWTTLIDKSKPMGFFRITIYGTNSP